MSGRAPPSPNQPAVPPLPSYISSQASQNPPSLPTAPPLPSYILSQGSSIPTFQQANIPLNHPSMSPLPDYISNIPISLPIAPPLPSYITPQRSNIATSQQSTCMLPSDISASHPSTISKNSTTQNELDSIQSMKEDFPSTSSAQSSLGSDFESNINKNPKNIDPNLILNKAVTSPCPPPPPLPPPPPTTTNLNTQMDNLQMENHLNPIKTSTESIPPSPNQSVEPPPHPSQSVGLPAPHPPSQNIGHPSQSTPSHKLKPEITSASETSMHKDTNSPSPSLASKISAQFGNLHKTNADTKEDSNSEESSTKSDNCDTPASSLSLPQQILERSKNLKKIPEKQLRPKEEQTKEELLKHRLLEISKAMHTQEEDEEVDEDPTDWIES